jgi:hypothetical protein
MGYIYKLCCKNESIPDIYIGSTKNHKQRELQHQSACNMLHNRKVYNFINDNGGWDGWDFVVIDTVDGNAEMLLRAERYWYDKYAPSLNTNSVLLTENERIEKRKAACKRHYLENRESLIEQQLIHRVNHMEAYLAYQKMYRTKNRDAISIKMKTKNDCPCGGKFTYSNKLKHLDSAKHLSWSSQSDHSTQQSAGGS